jgi:predicted nucleotidyltransferase component of viral defense system
MNEARVQTVEGIQKLVAGIIATNPAGHRLCLIGGFRYRLLSRSCRMSLDIDYHWDGDMDGKQRELVDLLRMKLLPEVRRRFGYEGTVGQGNGPDADSPFVRTVLAALYRTGESPDRIELPVEITCIPCLDSPVVRTVSGTVYLTTSDADMIESKVIALINRLYLEARDILDLFLFQDNFAADSAGRLRTKFAMLQISPAAVVERSARLLKNRVVYTRAIDAIIDDQVDAAVAANLRASGGGAMIFDAVVNLLVDKLGIPKGIET